MNKIEKAVQMGLGTFIVIVGNEVGLSALEGHWVPLLQALGAAVLMVTFYSLLDRGDK